MKRFVIVAGAPIMDAQRIKEYLTDDDFYVFCDSGLKHAAALGVRPDLIVGDFDSHPDPHADCETIVLPHVKDDTDTAFAVKEGVRRGYEVFLLIGMTGARPDHTLGNVQLLFYLRRRGKRAMIVDDYAEMQAVGETPVEIADDCKYFSLLNLSGTARGVTIENAKYPLTDAALSTDDPLGVSNEVLSGKNARVVVKEGEALLVRVLRE